MNRRDLLEGMHIIGTTYLISSILAPKAEAQSYNGHKKPEQKPKSEHLEKIVKSGQPAPDFRLTGLDGKSYRLYDPSIVAPVVINYFESWCPHCVKEMPSLDQFAREHEGKVTTLVITSDQEGASSRHIKEKGYTSFKTLIDDAGMSHRLYGIFGFPITFVVDRDRIVRFLQTGFTNFMDPSTPLRLAIEDLLENKIPLPRVPSPDNPHGPLSKGTIVA